MSMAAIPAGLFIAFIASLQDVDVSGQYQCVRQCLGVAGQFAFITQDAWELKILCDGKVSTARIDYSRRLRIDRVNVEATYSRDGMTIQFDGGMIWQRVL